MYYKCPKGSSSLPGSTACTTLDPHPTDNSSTNIQIESPQIVKYPDFSSLEIDPSTSPSLPPSSLAAQCEPGYYSATGSAPCVSCPAGQFSSLNGSTTCGVCASNRYSHGGSSACTSCPYGYVAAPGSSQCLASCPAGQYPSTAGCRPVNAGLWLFLTLSLFNLT